MGGKIISSFVRHPMLSLPRGRDRAHSRFRSTLVELRAASSPCRSEVARVPSSLDFDGSCRTRQMRRLEPAPCESLRAGLISLLFIFSCPGLVLIIVPCASAWCAPFVAYGSSRRIAFSGTPASFGLVPGAVRDCLRCSHLARVDADAGVARLAILDNP